MPTQMHRQLEPALTLGTGQREFGKAFAVARTPPGRAFLIGEPEHTTDGLDPIFANALSRDTGKALRFGFLACEFRRELHGSILVSGKDAWLVPTTERAGRPSLLHLDLVNVIIDSPPLVMR